MINVFYLILTLFLLCTGAIRSSYICLLEGLVLFFSLVLSSLIALRVSKKNDMELELKTQVATKNKKIICLALVQEKSVFPTGPVSYHFVQKNELTGEQKKVKGRLNRKGVQVMSPYCGCIDLQLCHVRFHDWFDVVRIPGKQEISRKLFIMPDTFPVNVKQPSAAVSDLDPEEYSPYKKGQDLTETFQIREYVPGNPLSQIHWKLSGKMDQLMVRDASLPIVHSLMIFWDRSGAKEDPAVEDALCEAVSSVAQAYAQEGISFTLCWNYGDLLQRRDISSEEELPEAVFSMLKDQSDETTLHGTELYLHDLGSAQSGKIFYFSKHIPDRLEEFAGNSQIRLFLCSAEKNGLQGEDENGMFWFSPETMEEVFENIILE